jgi:hypothetical protein
MTASCPIPPCRALAISSAGGDRCHGVELADGHKRRGVDTSELVNDVEAAKYKAARRVWNQPGHVLSGGAM